MAVAGLILQSGHQVASPPRVLVGPLLMAAAALLVIAAAQGVRGALVGLILFMAADLGYYGLSCTLDEPGAKLDGLLAQTVAPAGRSATTGGPDAQRVFAPPAYGRHESAAIGNQMTLAGWSRTDGYAALAAEQVVGLLPTAGLARGLHALGPSQPFDLGHRGPDALRRELDASARSPAAGAAGDARRAQRQPGRGPGEDRHPPRGPLPVRAGPAAGQAGHGRA